VLRKEAGWKASRYTRQGASNPTSTRNTTKAETREKAAAAHQAAVDAGFEDDTVDEGDFEVTVRRIMAARMQGEAGCAGLRVFST
jgi:hypothetical protein